MSSSANFQTPAFVLSAIPPNPEFPYLMETERKPRLWDDIPGFKPVILKPPSGVFYLKGQRLKVNWKGAEILGCISDGLRISSQRLRSNSYLQAEAEVFWGLPWEEIKGAYEQETELLLLLLKVG